MLFVLIPGMDGTGDHFDALVDATPPEHETAVVSYPPDREFSYAEYVALVTERLPTGTPFVLLGESFSGPVSVLVASANPPGLAGVVLCNTFVVGPSWSGFRHLPWRLILSLPTPRLAIGYYLSGLSRTGDLAQRIIETNRKVLPRVRGSRVREALAVDVRRELAALECPVLCLRGTRDPLIRSRSLRAIQQARPTVSVREFDAPHLLLQVDPSGCWKAMQHFVESRCAA